LTAHEEAHETRARLEFGVLGPVLVARDGVPVRLGGGKQRAVVAALLLAEGRVMSTSALIDALWGDEPPPTAQKTLQIYISRLRRDLGPGADAVLATRGTGYLLNADTFDLAQVQALAASGREALPTDPLGAAERFRAALALWRGAPLSDVAAEPFARAAIPRLEELRLSIVDDRLAAELAAGRHARLVGELRQLASDQPLREQIHANLMLALYRCGRQAEALEVYRELRDRLAAELAIDPNPELRRLQQQILEQDPALMLAPPPAADRPRSELTRELPTAAPDARLPSPARRAHRRRAIAAVATLLIAGGAAVGVVLTRSGSGAPPPFAGRTSPNSVAVVNARTLTLVSDVPVGADPGPIAIGSGAVWVGNIDDHTVTELSQSAARVLKTYGLSDAPSSLTPSGDQIWIGNSFAGTLSRILVPYQQLSAPFYPGRAIGGLLALAAAGPNLWVGLSDSQLVQLDGHTLRISTTVHVPGRVKSIAMVDGSPWTLQFTGDGVDRIDVTSRAARPVARLRGDPVQIASGLGSVWIITTQPSLLWRLDPTTGRILSSTPLEQPPTEVAVGAGSVWVVEAQSGTIERISASGQVVHADLQLGRPVGGIAILGDAVYLTLAP
jgi:DNA-binding SARP family transcriptional activator/streptogramin lyase